MASKSQKINYKSRNIHFQRVPNVSPHISWAVVPANVVQSNPTIKIRSINYMWEVYRYEVEEELKLLLGVEELDHKDPRYFQQRNAAAKLAMQKMSVEDRAILELGLEKRRVEGHPEGIQQ